MVQGSGSSYSETRKNEGSLRENLWEEGGPKGLSEEGKKREENAYFLILS